MLNEKLREKALEKTAEAIVMDPRSETTIRAHYQLAVNTEDDIQVSIFLHILSKAVQKHNQAGDIEDIIQEEYLQYIIKTSSTLTEKPKTRQRKYIENVPEGSFPDICMILL